MESIRTALAWSPQLKTSVSVWSVEDFVRTFPDCLQWRNPGAHHCGMDCPFVISQDQLVTHRLDPDGIGHLRLLPPSTKVWWSMNDGVTFVSATANLLVSFPMYMSNAKRWVKTGQGLFLSWPLTVSMERRLSR